MVSVSTLLADLVLACTMLEERLPEHLMSDSVAIKTQ